MKIVQQLDENLWLDFLANHPQANIFHTPEMHQVFTQAKGHHPTLWSITSDDNQVYALFLPVQITLYNGPLRTFTSRAVSYGSVLFLPNPKGYAALGKLLRSYAQKAKHSVLFTELRNLSDLQDVCSILQEQGFQYEDHLNFLINLDRPLPKIWNAIRSNARRNIKKAQGSGLQIRELGKPEDLQDAYSVLETVYKRIQVPLPDFSLFRSAFDVLHPKGMLRILLAKLQNETIGVCCLLQYKGIATYWYTGTLREYASYRAGDLLVWKAIELSKQEGCHTFDFGGGGKPNEEYGVRDFKAKFGGKLINYGRYVCIHNPMRLKISQAGYRMIRRFL